MPWNAALFLRRRLLGQAEHRERFVEIAVFIMHQRQSDGRPHGARFHQKGFLEDVFSIGASVLFKIDHADADPGVVAGGLLPQYLVVTFKSVFKVPCVNKIVRPNQQLLDRKSVV